MKTKLLSAALFCALASFAAGVEIKYVSGAYEISGWTAVDLASRKSRS
ncbi:hypothetical protein [uncultured Campylobacter sp.]|nr:hypothetical protein [uncultured Campylobacter sp.]